MVQRSGVDSVDLFKMTNVYGKPIPDLEDPYMAPFWRGTRDKVLLAQRCTNCEAFRFPALPICDTCLDESCEWVEVSKMAKIWSYVVYHRAFHPGFKSDLPYVVGIVENNEGLRFTGNIIGARDSIQVGSQVIATFEEATAEFTIVKWRVV